MTLFMLYAKVFCTSLLLGMSTQFIPLNINSFQMSILLVFLHNRIDKYCICVAQLFLLATNGQWRRRTINKRHRGKIQNQIVFLPRRVVQYGFQLRLNINFEASRDFHHDNIVHVFSFKFQFSSHKIMSQFQIF